MYAGRIVEQASVRAVLPPPAPSLCAGSAGCLGERGRRRRRAALHARRRLTEIPGRVASAAGEPGCPFAPRCPMWSPACRAAPPPLEPVADGWDVACIVAARSGGDDMSLLSVDGLRTRYVTQRPRGQRRRRRVAGRGARRNRRPGGRERLRQIHPRQDHPAPAGPDRGQHPVSRQRNLRSRPARAAAVPAADADGLPGPVRLAQSAPDHRHAAGNAAEGARARQPGRAARGGCCDIARPRRPAGGGARPLSARILRRPAAAHRHRPRAGAGAGADRLRRAGVGAGPVDPGADPEPAGRPQARPGPELPVHLARSVGGALLRRPRAGDVSRPHRRERRPCRAVAGPAPPLHPGAAGGGAAARPGAPARCRSRCAAN